MADVYSSELLVYAGLTSTLIYDVPDGETVVLRDFCAYWGGGPAGSPSVRLMGSVGQTIVEFHKSSSDVTSDLDSQSWHWTGRQVIEPGETFSVSVAGPPADISVSGYRLT